MTGEETHYRLQHSHKREDEPCALGGAGRGTCAEEQAAPGPQAWRIVLNPPS